MENEPSKSVVDAWIALMRAQHAALLKVERALRDAGLPPFAWYDALWELDRAKGDGLRPYAIEHGMLMAQSNVSRLLDRLETNGLVERRPCKEDGRGHLVAITEAGRDLRRRIWPVYAAAINDAVGAQLSEDEAAKLAGLLRQISAHHEA